MVMEYIQYDIYVFDPDPTRGHEVKKIRPCVIISPNELNQSLETVIIAPLTTKIRNFPFRPTIVIDRVHGCIMVDQMRAVDKSRLTKKIATLPRGAVIRLKEIIQEMLVD